MPDQVGKFDFAGIPAEGADFSGIAPAAGLPAPANTPNYDYSYLPDLLLGALKGAGRSAVGLGRVFNPSIPADADMALGLTPANATQGAGQTLERIAEFFIPGGATKNAAATLASHLPLLGRAAPVAARAATEGATNAVISQAQGGSPATGGAVGAAASVLPAAGKALATRAGEYAEPLVRAAVKPTVTAMKQVAGASYTGIEAQAKRLTRFILDNGITTAAKAEAIIKDSEKTLRGILDDASNLATDAPQRAMRYLGALERSAAKQNLPAEDVATIRNAAQEMLDESGLGVTKTRTVMKDSPSGLVDPSGKRVQVPTQESYRELRTDVSPQEALDRARANSKWDTKKQWGEQKGAKTEASKAIERAERDSVKAAVPEAAPVLRREGQAIQTKKVLDRMEFRQANRDAVSLPAHVVAAGEIARGRVPVMALAANWLRNNQMKAGVWANRLDQAVKRGDVDTVTEIMNRLGVPLTAAAATSGQ